VSRRDPGGLHRLCLACGAKIPFYEVTDEEKDRRIAGYAIESNERRFGQLITGTTMQKSLGPEADEGKIMLAHFSRTARWRQP
jgi:hypothetical protein